MTDSGPPAPRSEFLLYRTEDGGTRLSVRFDAETVWLTPAQLAELVEEATIKSCLTVGCVVGRRRRVGMRSSGELRVRDSAPTGRRCLQVGRDHRRLLPTPVTQP